MVLPAHVSAQENETEMTGDFVPVGLGSETKQGTTQDAGEEDPHPAPGSAKDSAEGAETDIGSELTDTKLSDINTRFLERYYQQLLSTKAVENPVMGRSRNELVGPSTIRDIHKVLRSCFKQAVKWELIEKVRFNDESNFFDR